MEGVYRIGLAHKSFTYEKSRVSVLPQIIDIREAADTALGYNHSSATSSRHLIAHAHGMRDISRHIGEIP